MKTETPADSGPVSTTRKRSSARAPRPASGGARKGTRRGMPSPESACATDALLRELGTPACEAGAPGSLPEQSAHRALEKPKPGGDVEAGAAPAGHGAWPEGANASAGESSLMRDSLHTVSPAEAPHRAQLRRGRSGWFGEQLFPVWCAQGSSAELWAAYASPLLRSQARSADDRGCLPFFVAPFDCTQQGWLPAGCTWTAGVLQAERAVASLAGIAQPFDCAAPLPQSPARAASVQLVAAACFQSVRPAATALLHAAAQGWRWLLARRKAQVASRRLRVVETVALGEKRFATLLHVDGAQFLIGGGSAGVSLLARIDPTNAGRSTPERELWSAADAEPQATQAGQGSADEADSFAAVLRDRSTGVQEDSVLRGRTRGAPASRPRTGAIKAETGTACSRLPNRGKHDSPVPVENATVPVTGTVTTLHSSGFPEQIGRIDACEKTGEFAAAREIVC